MQGRRLWSPALGATATNTFKKLKCNFNICATDISTTTAASTSCKGIHLNHTRDTDAFKPGHPTHSAEPSGKQRTAAAIQRAANFLLNGRRPTGWIFKATYVHKALQPCISCLCYRQKSQHNISRLSSFFRNLHSVMSYQQIDKPQPFLPADMPAPIASLQPPPPHNKNNSSH